MATTATVQAAITALSSTSTIEEATLLAYDTNSLTQDRMIAVDTAASLPDLGLGNIAPGTILFVDEYKVPVVSNGSKWIGLDSRVLRDDFVGGDLRTWGEAILGDNTIIDRSSPVSIVSVFSDWCQVSAGNCFFLGLRSNGTVWAWGDGACGRLGNCFTTDRLIPVSVACGFADWCQVSAGDTHSLGVRSNGTAWAWGGGTSGQLGINFAGNAGAPYSVVGGFTDWCQVSAGGDHSLGLRTNGTAWAWGANTCGQLGDGTVVNQSSPVQVSGGFTDWSQVSAGSDHSLGIRSNGTAWAWGFNLNGQLGDNTITNKSSPVSVVGNITDWCQLSGGLCHSVGIRADGTMWSWGDNFQRQLGISAISDRSSPVSVLGGFTDWCAVSAGRDSNIGVRTNGTLWGWGDTTYGVLGDNTSLIGRSSPVPVVGGFTDWCAVSVGWSSSAGIRIVP